MTRFTLDRESFQKLLACAFAVQQTLLDDPSPSAMLGLRHLLVTGQLNLNVAVRLVAGCARNVANATGVAIGLLELNQLAYVAGSGSAAAYIGRRVSATLSVAANTRDKGVILRVENAEVETRIEGAICRQFGARSLLILPIYRDRVLAGVIEIFFDEAHVFHDREVCTYRLMADTVGEALTCAPFRHKTHESTTPTTAQETMRQTAIREQNLPDNIESMSNMPFTCPKCGAATDAGKLALQARSASAERILKPTNRCPTPFRWWSFADSAAVMIALVTAGWIGYSSGHSASPFPNSTQQMPDAHQQQGPLLPTRSAVKNTSREQPELIPTERVLRVEMKTPKRVVTGDQEIDYVSEDVTVRHFKPKLVVKPPKKPADSRSK